MEEEAAPAWSEVEHRGWSHMPNVLVTGWRPGLYKVALDKLFRTRPSVSLKNAFTATNRSAVLTA